MESNYLEELPNTISKLINLEELNLQNNSLTSIPSEIGHLRNLATLILSDNKLKQLPAGSFLQTNYWSFIIKYVIILQK